MGASFKSQMIFHCSVQQMIAIIKDPAFCKKLNLQAVEVVREVQQEPQQEGEEQIQQETRQEENRIAFHFTHGVTFTSWGENITLSLLPEADGGVCVEVYSVCVEEQQMIDAGKNKSNTKHILAYIEGAVKKQEETMQAAAYQAAALQAAYQSATMQMAALQAAQPVQPMQPVIPVQPMQPAQPDMSQRRFCIHCGKPLQIGARFCAFCGAPQ